MKTLYITWDGVEWDDFSRSYSYTAQFGLVDAFSKFSDVFQICLLKHRPPHYDLQNSMMNFLIDKNIDADCIVFPICHSTNNQKFFEWIKKSFSIRIAVLTESLTKQSTIEMYTPHLLENVCKYFNHVLVYDDLDIMYFQKKTKVKFIPTPINAKDFLFIPFNERIEKISFWGREDYDEERREEVKYLKKYPIFSLNPKNDNLESENIKKLCFDHNYMLSIFDNRILEYEELIEFSKKWQNIRHDIYKNYLNKISKYISSISLFSAFGSYPGRIFESIAAGVPMICKKPEINRFITKNLLIENNEIFWYDDIRKVNDIFKQMNKIGLENIAIKSQNALYKYSIDQMAIEINSWINAN